MRYRIRRRRRRSSATILFVLVCIFFPCAFLVLQGHTAANKSLTLKGPDAAAVTESSAVTGTTTVGGETVSLLRTATGNVENLDLEEYIIGVVAAEMPVNFESEALKAQAVVARTYALRKMADNAWQNDSDGSDLSDDSGHDQAYHDIDTLKSSWGDSFTENYQKISAAVMATKGQVLTYDGDLAYTYYCSTCGGRTASSKEVWGTDYPYLQSVKCKWCKDAPRYEETTEIALADLPWLLGDGSSPCIAVAAGEKTTEMPVTEGETESGRVEAISYAGLTFSATDFRTALSLNSTNFTLKEDGDQLEVTTVGFGHGVGLCQYGANGMAKDGRTYGKILSYYYKGTELTNLQNKD